MELNINIKIKYVDKYLNFKCALLGHDNIDCNLNEMMLLMYYINRVC